MNWMGHAAPKVGVEAKDHEAWEEEEAAAARSHVPAVMVPDREAVGAGSDGQRFPETRQSDCDRNNRRRNHPADTKHYYYDIPS
jgi:hypothetical protein